MSQQNQVITEIEGGHLVQLDGTITDKNGVPIKAESGETKSEAKVDAETKAKEAADPPRVIPAAPHRGSRR